MTQAERVAKANEHTEWLRFLYEARRYGADSQRAVEIADVLVYGEVQEVNR